MTLTAGTGLSLVDGSRIEDRDWDRGAPDGAVGAGIGEHRFSKLACHRLRGKGNHEVVEGAVENGKWRKTSFHRRGVFLYNKNVVEILYRSIRLCNIMKLYEFFLLFMPNGESYYE